MNDTTPPRRAWYWERWVTPEGAWRRGQGPPGEDLAALRQGASGEPGAVPALWPFYATETAEDRLDPRSDDWEVDPALAAEHHALVLFGIHQQSQPRPVHRPGSRPGAALSHLRSRFSEDAVDRRVTAAVASAEVGELCFHLRGLVRQLRTLGAEGALDYSRLTEDLRRWHFPDRRSAIRRRWGLDYYRRTDDGGQTDPDPSARPDPTPATGGPL